MNKYLVKIAQINTFTRQRIHGDASTTNHAKEIQDTAVIGGLGGAVTYGTHSLLNGARVKAGLDAMSKGRKALTVAAIGTATGLAADYAGIKINKALDGVSNTKEQNVAI